jgi:uncharacterized membrane protein YbjE (DUF340 family)
MLTAILALVLALLACLLMGLGFHQLVTTKNNGIKITLGILLFLVGSMLGSGAIEEARSVIYSSSTPQMEKS